ncbi:MAG: S-adenosylmethionine:tRNA ribosyltransferase-isomerase [Rhodospirillaceae bacterium]|nr:S-adenosylmethionine:tRNA ribosyltransferase-isomerase [Rhodospirillaceae bacterium]
MGLISLVIVYLGVASPLREIHRLSIPDVLQPRFLSNGERDVQMAQRGFSWLIPPMLAAGWIGMRPFMESWLSVVYFFLFEAAFVGLLAVATLWWLSPFLRGTIRVFETLFRAVLPLETFLTGRRMRLNSKRLVFSVTGVTLVFSLLTGLHEPRATHLAMLLALAGPDHVCTSYAAALDHDYLWHEFGDLHLIIP